MAPKMNDDDVDKLVGDDNSDGGTNFGVNLDLDYDGNFQDMAAAGATPQQRHSLSFMPSSSTGSLPEHIPASQSYHSYMDKNGGGSGSVTPKVGDPSGHRMAKMEAQLANLTAWVQTAVSQDHALSAQSQTSLTSEAGSMRSTPDQQVPPPPSQTLKGLSDSSTATPTPAACSAEMQHSLRALHAKARELSSEVKSIRRTQLQNAETIRETIHEASKKLQTLLSTVPGANEQPVRAERIQVNDDIDLYRQDAARVDKLLCDLEESVEELRNEVVNRRCRVTQTDVEGMALALSQISRSLADFKSKFPEMMDKMKKVMAGEMEIVVREEKFLKEEPERIDSSLRRCKKITGTLYTLKRLASVQENKPPIAPAMATNTSPKENDKRAVLESIQAVVPDHDARLQKVEAAEASRERKKNISSQQEALKFQKSLEMASKNLKDPKPDKKTNGKKDVKDPKKDTKEKGKDLKDKGKDSKEKGNAGKDTRGNQGKDKGNQGRKEVKDKGKDVKDKGKLMNKKGKKDEKTPEEVDSIQKVITQEVEVAVSKESGEAETPTIQGPPTVEYIMVPSQTVRNAPAPKLSSFSPPPTTNFDNYYSSFSRLLVSTAHVRGRSVSPEPVYSRPTVHTEPQTVQMNQIGSPPQTFGNHLENPYAIGRPRPASISGPIHTTLHERTVISQHPNDVMSKSTTSAESKTVTFDPWVEMKSSQSKMSTFAMQGNGTTTHHSRPLPVHISEKQHNMYAQASPPEPLQVVQAQEQPKKRVPPPPPPRKSSRSSIQVPKTRQSPNDESDYENIESVRAAIKEAQAKKSPGQGQTPSPGQVPVMVPVSVNHSRSSSEPVSTSTPIEKHIIGRRQVSKFHKDYMVGVYANMNRPDLQEQNINLQRVVHSPDQGASSGKEGSSGSSSETSSIDSQKGLHPGKERGVWRKDPNLVANAVSVATRQQIFEKQGQVPAQHRLSQGEVRKTMQMHEQYSKYQQVPRDQFKRPGGSPGSSPQEVKANNVRTEITHNPQSPQAVTSPVITRSKVVINLQTGRKEEETDIY